MSVRDSGPPRQDAQALDARYLLPIVGVPIAWWLGATLARLAPDLGTAALPLSIAFWITLALAILATAMRSVRVGGPAKPALSLAMTILGGAALAALYGRTIASTFAIPTAATAILLLAIGVGTLVGSRVERAGHALPASFVAAAADVASVVHPAGISHAIAATDRAVSVLAIGCPVFGVPGVSFALGVGDFAFAAILFGLAARHGVSLVRVGIAVWLGAAVALLVAALTGAPIPALVTIGTASIALVPPFRRVERKDKTVTQLSIALSIGVTVAVLLRARS